MILIESLLREISDLYKKAEEDRQEREKQGDFFNVFNTIGLRTEEVRLHSALIAELLNPQGKHGLSHLFLEAFLEMLESSGFLDFSKISQENKERY
ncbi:MAG: PD-(D/E)XK nuclease family protein, partial [Bacteroidaceae bacterium]|nr:PD-(D/E)XK nuclease family protein [Bacteroidaceae bacterium]